MATSDRLTKAVARARSVLAALADGAAVAIDKTVFGSPAGKKRIADRLVAMLPAHKTYVEPFAGSAAVLFAKEPSEVEVINDADVEIANAYKAIKRLAPKDLEKLAKMPWVGDEATFKRIFDASPKDELGKLHRFLYVSHFSYGKLRSRSFSPVAEGVEATTLKRLEKAIPRLKNVRVFGGDYEKVIKEFDGKETVFFLDPPYSGYNVDVGEGAFDDERFFGVLKGIKGKFLMTCGIRGKLPELLKSTDFVIKRIRTPRTIASMRGVGGPSVLTQLVVSNYTPTEKSLSDGCRLEEWDREVDSSLQFEKATQLLKGLDPNDERYVLGIVLEPETVDAQGDIYSTEEIRSAAHRFMEEFGGLGFMHRLRVNDQVKVLESFLAPTDFALGEVTVKRGTWLLAVRVLSDELWTKVKGGQLTGFSIGGSARREPEATLAEGA